MPARLIDSLRAQLRSRPLRAMTFDVFDTFLFRGCTTPDGVFELAARRALPTAIRPSAVDSYLQQRQQSEARAHHEAKKATGFPEIPITEVYAGFPVRLFGMGPEAVPDLIAAEFQAEIDLCFVNPDMAALHAEAQRCGLKVGFISDTYWDRERLGALLRSCAPGLHWDFLYASCDYGTSKSEDLFGRALIEQGLQPTEVLHIGDNENADIKGARRFGIAAIHVPQASEHLASVLQRERTAFQLLTYSHGSARLDQGMSALRRLIAARTDAGPDGFQVGVQVLGPIMAAFDRFIADRTAQLSRRRGRTAVAFLARDGMLAFDIWRAGRRDTACYLEINRRVALIGSAQSLEPMAKLFRHFTAVDEPTITAILKIQSPRLSAFFDSCPGKRCSGEDFADAIPDIFDASECEALATAMRKELLIYLRKTIPDFDNITDLILVDLGYCGSIQKAIRRVLDLEGIRVRLHGLYLLSFDDAFAEIAAPDTAEGFISDLVVSPRVNRALGRNATILEHACCAPHGSVRGYKDGIVLREPDPRPADQLAMCTDIQAGALHFVRHLNELSASEGLDPFTDLDLAANRAAAILARFLLLPTDDELVLLGGMRHDINLGTQALVATADPGAGERLNVALALPTLCTAPEPPMWIAGTMASVSPAHGFLYALFGAGHLPGDIFGDARCGSIDVTAIAADSSRPMPVSCFRNGLGEVRIRIPVSRAHGTLAVSVPLARVATEGLLAGMTLQSGDTIAEAMADREVQNLPWTARTGIGIAFTGNHYRSIEAERHELMIRIPVLRRKIGVVTILVKPLSGSRVLALATADEDRAPKIGAAGGR